VLKTTAGVTIGKRSIFYTYPRHDHGNPGAVTGSSLTPSLNRIGSWPDLSEQNNDFIPNENFSKIT
jgi:hypothetical protein